MRKNSLTFYYIQFAIFTFAILSCMFFSDFSSAAEMKAKITEVKVFDGVTEDITLDDFVDKFEVENFKDSKPQHIPFKTANGFSWVFIKVEIAESNFGSDYSLFYGNSTLKNFEYYQVADDFLERTPESRKEYFSIGKKNDYAGIHLDSIKGTYSFLVKLKWQIKPYGNFYLASEDSFFSYWNSAYSTNGILVGASVVLMFFQVLFFFSFRHKAFLGYFLYIGSMALIVAVSVRKASFLIGSAVEDVLVENLYILMNVPVLCALYFSYHFLGIKNYRKTKLAYFANAGATICVIIGSLVWGKSFFLAGKIFTATMFALVVGSGIYASNIKLKNKVFFVSGWLIFAFSYVAWDFFVASSSEAVVLYASLPVFGSMAEYFFMTLSMSDMFVKVTKTAKKSNQNRKTSILLQRLIRLVVHDIANPLSVAKGNISLANRKDDLEFKKKRLVKVESALDKIEEILNTVRKFRNISSNDLSIETVPVSADEVYGSIKDIFFDHLERKNITFEFEEEDSVFVLADKSSLTNEVMMNLVGNAIKFSNEGSKIIVKAYYQDDNSVIEVRDFGMGMSDQKVEEILGEGTVTSEIGTAGETGTGFGVQIARQFLELYGAEMSVDSKIKGHHKNGWQKEESGTIFILTFKKAEILKDTSIEAA